MFNFLVSSFYKALIPYSFLYLLKTKEDSIKWKLIELLLNNNIEHKTILKIIKIIY